MRITPYSSNVSHIGLFGLVAMALTVLLGADYAVADNALPVEKAQVQEAYGKLPLYFEANRGQTDPQVKFLFRGPRSTLFLTPTEAVLALRSAARPTRAASIASVTEDVPDATTQPTQETQLTVLRTSFVGANPKTRVEGQEELPGKANYFIGNDPKKWRANVPTYAKVQHRDLYPGIDLIYYGNQRQLEYDFVVAPGADPNLIKLGFHGAKEITLADSGDLILTTEIGDVRLQKPLVYQFRKDGHKELIAGNYVIRPTLTVSSSSQSEGTGHASPVTVAFQIADYDASRPLIIDPVLFYSTYLGAGDDDAGFSIAVDVSGNAYVAGYAVSTNFPTTPGVFQSTLSGPIDAFVTKLNPTGSGLVYSTYLGGSNNDEAFGIGVDAAGNAYVAGATDSTNFPTTPGAFQTTLSGGNDLFITKLNPTGSGLVYSTYLGGSEFDNLANGIAVDAAGNAYVSGLTFSTDFPTTIGAFQTAYGGGIRDAFVTKLNPLGTGLVYSTYLGGSDNDYSFGGVTVDAAGNAYVAGFTESTDFPTTPGAFQTTYAGGGDVFVTKLNPLGSGLVYSTYLGGSGFDTSTSIAVDAAGNAYVAGLTDSTNFPTTSGAFQTTFGGGSDDAFITKLNPLGSGLVYSTYLGGSGFDLITRIALDAQPNPDAYVTGGTDSTDFPTTTNAFQTALGGVEDAFVTKLNPTGSGLVYSTYLGGSGDDEGFGIALDTLPNPNAYVVGFTESTNFPTTPGAFQPAFGGVDDAFVAKITEAMIPPGQAMERVTGGGTINVAGGIGSFSFIVQRQASTGQLSGHLQYFNHASGAQVRSDTITSLMIVGNTATFNGICTVNGIPCTFTVNVTDNGEPGTTDTFTISVDGGPTEGGTLRSGNILITQ